MAEQETGRLSAGRRESGTRVSGRPESGTWETGRPEHGRPVLADVHRVLADRQCAALSLDVFDTVLWRRAPRPTDAFALLAHRLRDAGLCPEWVTDATFRRMRIAAEKKARTERGGLGSEVSLSDIWAAMPLDGDPGRLTAAEVALEREITVVDEDIAAVIQAAAKHGIPIVLVSDTYFSGDQLDRLLDRPGLEPLRDARVYRSNQHGTDKGKGLWEIVLNDLGLSPQQVVHIGDNEIADDRVPGELGVRTVHYVRLDDPYRAMLEREAEPLDGDGPDAPDLDPVHGDHGLTSLRAKALHATGPHPSTALDVAWRFGAAVMGPVLTGFAEWAAYRAHETGVRTLWCPMREGELLSELINAAARARGLDVTAKPVWLSRFTTSLAGLDPHDEDAVHAFCRSGYRMTVRQALEALGLQAGEVPGLATELTTIIDNGDIAERVARTLTETPHLRNRIAETVTAVRERLLKSLRAAGALDGDDLTLVDLGWGGTIQRQLGTVLELAGIDLRPSGLYLATDRRSERLYLAGLRAEGYLAQAGHPSWIAGTLTRSPEIIEQSVNALCGSLIGFTTDGGPILGPVSDSPSQNAERRLVHDGARAFQRLWNRHAEQDGWPTLAEDGPVRTRLARILVAALEQPAPEEAAVFGVWGHEDNFGSDLVTHLLPDDLRAAIPYLHPAALADLHMRDSFWPALLAASDPQLAALTRAVARGDLPAAALEPAGDPTETRLRYRTDDDRWHEEIRSRVRVNHNGLSFARLRFEHHDTVDISLAVPGRPAIVRVDWIEAKVLAEGRRGERVLRWDDPEDFVGLHYADCRYLGGNLVEFFVPHAAIWLPLARRAGVPVVSSGEITVAFAMLPQSRSGSAARMPVDRQAANSARRTRLTNRLREEYQTTGVKGVAAGASRVARRKLGGTP
ncbi:HAD family hydrolase [Spirillospora sp. NPDC052269]